VKSGWRRHTPKYWWNNPNNVTFVVVVVVVVMVVVGVAHARFMEKPHQILLSLYNEKKIYIFCTRFVDYVLDYVTCFGNGSSSK
jgi:hypothetical protein